MVDIRNKLKGYFKQGDKPTESQFAEWIDNGLFNITSCKWSELKDLRDKSKLNPGQLYRITDYSTIVNTSISYIQSMGHLFDIVVFAISADILSEQALAINHEGDTYFEKSNLTAWRLWYCLDNDVSRFNWANEVSGKGVIYRMIDEHNNDVPYDFKNIVTKFSGLDYFTYLFSSRIGGDYVDGSVYNTRYFSNNKVERSNTYQGICCIKFEDNGTDNIVYYGGGNSTISGNNNIIGSCNNIIINGHRNTIGTGCSGITIQGNDNIINGNCYNITLGTVCNCNTFDSGCNNIELGRSNQYNSFGVNSSYITLGPNCTNNTFYASCINITFAENCNRNSLIMDSVITLGIGCNDNSFDTNCTGITLGKNCTGNHFGPNCSGTTGEIVFGDECKFNSLGSGCSGITLGSKSSRNSLGNYCRKVYLGASSYSNSFGNDCTEITLGTSNKFNSFGNQCNYIKFGNSYTSCRVGNECSGIGCVSSSSLSVRHFCRNIEFLSGVQSAYIRNVNTAAANNQIQNIIVTQLRMVESELVIEVPTNNVSTLIVGANSSGSLTLVNIFDLVG